MAKKKSILVYKRTDGKWVSQRKGETQVSGVYSTREEALHAADELIQLRGNGEIIISSHQWTRTGPSAKKRSETVTVAHQKRKRKKPFNKVRVRFQNGHFIPLEPLEGIGEGDELAIKYELPDNVRETLDETLQRTAGMWTDVEGIEEYLESVRQQWDEEWQRRISSL